MSRVWDCKALSCSQSNQNSMDLGVLAGETAQNLAGLPWENGPCGNSVWKLRYRPARHQQSNNSHSGCQLYSNPCSRGAQSRNWHSGRQKSLNTPSVSLLIMGPDYSNESFGISVRILEHVYRLLGALSEYLLFKSFTLTSFIVFKCPERLIKDL